MLETFQEQAKGRQLYIEQPDVCALVFARNDKRSSFTGFFKNIWKNTYLNTKEFLLAHALPGPNAKINCILQKKGSAQRVERCLYVKEVQVCQIPAFTYSHQPIPEINVMKSWAEAPIEKMFLESWELEKRDPIVQEV